MGNSHLGTLLYVSVIPAALTAFALSAIRVYFDLTHFNVLLLAIPVWIAVLLSWVFGMAGIATLLASAYLRCFPMPRCKTCDKPLGTRLAKQCLHCGADWHDT